MKKHVELAAQFIELAPLMIRTVKGEIQAVSKGRLTHPQYRILANINRGVNTVSQIALNQGVSQPAMSKMVNMMVDRGLIERSSQSEDRRQIILKMSPKGLSLFRDLKAKAAQNFSVKLEKLSASERDHLAHALAELGTILRNSSLMKEKAP